MKTITNTLKLNSTLLNNNEAKKIEMEIRELSENTIPQELQAAAESHNEPGFTVMDGCISRGKKALK